MSSSRGSGPVELEDKQRQHLRDKLSAAIAERRHHDQPALQTAVGGMLILGIYLVALDSALTREQNSYTIQRFGFVLVISLGCALAAAVYWQIVDQRLKRDVCGEIADHVNGILADGRLDETELADEMSRSVIREKESRLRGRRLPMKPRCPSESVYLGMYVVMVILAFAILFLAYWPAAQRQAEESSVIAEKHHDSVEIAITMTGIGGDADAYAQHDPAGIAITMTGEEEDGNGARASATLVARTGSPDGGWVGHG